MSTTPPSILDRRDFVRALATILVAPASLGAAVQEQRDRLRELLSNRDWRVARTLGAEYLSHHPTEADEDSLSAEILDGWEEGDDLRAFLLGRVRDDFSTDRVVFVNDWLLSRTESRLYAIVQRWTG